MIEAWFKERDETGDVGLKILGSVTNFVCVCRGDKISYVNPAGARMLGFEESAEMVGLPFPDFVDPDYAELMALGLEAFAEEESGVPLKMIPREGEPRDVKLFITHLPIGDTDAFMVEALDITEYIKAAEATKLREQRLKGILDTVAEGIIAANEKGVIVAFNPAAERLFGYTQREAIGMNVSALMPEPYRSEHDGYLERYTKTGEKHLIGTTSEQVGRRKDGHLFPMEITVSELREGRARAYIGAMRDITSRKEYENQIKHLAHHDALTGLPNRNLYQDHLEKTLARAKREKTVFALMFIDLDKFKPVNDTYGHEAGDVVLKGVAERLSKHLRSSDIIARVGGDEFVVILDKITDKHDAGGVARKLIDALIEPFPFEGNDLQIGASIGIALFPDDAGDEDGLTKCADDAMYRVKEAGRNDFRYYADPDG